jgi:uncharacterized membrane protein (UPF0127 family)
MARAAALGAVVQNETRGVTLARQARWATNPLTHFFGLMGRAALPEGEALIFPGVQGIHTHFMRFAIDAVFYDRAQVVVHTVHALRPWRFSAYRRDAAGVIELPAGTLAATGTVQGDQLRF